MTLTLNLNHKIPNIGGCIIGSLQNQNIFPFTNSFVTYRLQALTNGTEIISKVLIKSLSDRLLVTIIMVNDTNASGVNSRLLDVERNGVSIGSINTGTIIGGITIFQFIDDSSLVNPTYSVDVNDASGYSLTSATIIGNQIS